MAEITIKNIPAKLWNKILEMKRNNKFGKVTNIVFSKNNIKLFYDKTINNTFKNKIKSIINRL